MALQNLTDEQILEIYEIKKGYLNNKDLSSQEQAYKTILNSLYGALATGSFQFYNIEIATAITLTGQCFTRSVDHYVNLDFIDKFKIEGITDFIPAGDTDSVMIWLGEIVKKYYKGENDKHKITDWIIEFDRLYLSKLIDRINNNVTEYLNAYDPSAINMKREVIADKALFLSKKHYIMNVIDKEGVRYYKFKPKMQGVEIIKSSTPIAVKDMLAESIPIIFYKTEKDLRDFCKEKKDQFKVINIADLAIPTGVNGVDKYRDGDTYRKRTPLHVRASLIHNKYLDKLGLSGIIEPIKSGDKIKWIPLITPNPITGMDDVIAFQGDQMPDFMIEGEHNVMDYIDYDRLYYRAFMKPIEGLTEPLNYNLSIETTLDDIFG